MTRSIEISTIDTRYEGCRIRQEKAESSLLSSIALSGIQEPLEGVETGSRVILLDGFKRYRCAKRLKISIVPYLSISTDEALGLVKLLRTSVSERLNILEQAQLVTELHKHHKMTLVEIGQHLNKSSSWASMRLCLLEALSEGVKGYIFRGEFSAYSYIYTVCKFMRLKNLNKYDVEKFVSLTAGKNLSTREIEVLAEQYFNGNRETRNQIRAGNIDLVLRGLNKQGSATCNDVECELLKILKLIHKLLLKTSQYSSKIEFSKSAFCAQLNLIAGNLLKEIPQLTTCTEELL